MTRKGRNSKTRKTTRTRVRRKGVHVDVDVDVEAGTSRVHVEVEVVVPPSLSQPVRSITLPVAPQPSAPPPEPAVSSPPPTYSEVGRLDEPPTWTPLDLPDSLLGTFRPRPRSGLFDQSFWNSIGSATRGFDYSLESLREREEGRVRERARELAQERERQRQLDRLSGLGQPSLLGRMHGHLPAPPTEAERRRQAAEQYKGVCWMPSASCSSERREAWMSLPLHRRVFSVCMTLISVCIWLLILFIVIGACVFALTRPDDFQWGKMTKGGLIGCVAFMVVACTCSFLWLFMDCLTLGYFTPMYYTDKYTGCGNCLGNCCAEAEAEPSWCYRVGCTTTP